MVQEYENVGQEELRLLRENNFMLKQIIQYLNMKNKNSIDMKEFFINVMANNL